MKNIKYDHEKYNNICLILQSVTNSPELIEGNKKLFHHEEIAGKTAIAAPFASCYSSRTITTHARRQAR